MKNDFLHQAYLATQYIVFVEGAEQYSLSIGVVNTEFEEWCVVNNIRSWAFITAYNPYSAELTKTENQGRNRKFEEYLITKGYTFHHGEGKPNNKDWESEMSFFIHNISEEEAIALGERYQQNAIVIGHKGRPAALKWLVA